MKDLRPITMYKCQHCGKLFKTPDKHNCRRDPYKTNCYSCEHWGHKFYWHDRDTGKDSCYICETCDRYKTSVAKNALTTMKESGWYLDCPDYWPEGIS